MRTGITLLLLTSVACSPAQRRAAGGVIGVGGLAFAGTSTLSMAVPPCRIRQHVNYACVEDGQPLPPSVGLPLVAVGAGVALLGGIILATASEQGRKASAEKAVTPKPPIKPAALSEAEAVGKAIGLFVLMGRDGQENPSSLLSVDNTQVKIRVEGRHAELWNLRIRTTADQTWRSVGACYEYEHEWQLTSLRTTPGCPP